MIRNIRYIVITAFVLLQFSVSHGQVLKDLGSKFESYCRDLPREEIFVSTDRNEYVSGEEVWFSASLFNRMSGKPGKLSSLIYVEILNPENHAIGQKKLLVTNGFSNGEIILPDTLASGCYTLRAYTSWMKNFLPLNCFEKKLTVYNALNLANGFSCKQNTKQNPGISSPDFTFAVANHTADIVDFVISAGDRYRMSNTNLSYIFIETRGKINYSALVNLPDASTKYSIPARYLTPGVNHITFFDTKGNPLAEKFIYTKGAASVHPALSAPDSVSTRDEVSAGFELPGGLSTVTDSSAFSISVTMDGTTVPDEITSYMVFGSEFGPLPDEISGKNPDELPSEVIDRFLAGTSSNWIDWDRILTGKSPKPSVSIEKESHFLAGRLLNRNTHKPLPGKILFLTAPGKDATFQYAITDNDGIFKFLVPVTEAAQELVIEPEENDKNLAVEIISPFSAANGTASSSVNRQDKNIPERIKTLSTNYQVNRIYGIQYASLPAQKEVALPPRKRFYGKPDMELKMDDYIKLPVMQEVFYELLPGVSLKSRKNGYEISIIDPVDNRVQKKPPQLFIDGVMIDDASLIANIDPELVERIDVIKEKYFVGDYVFYGLINVITRSGDFSAATLPEKALKLKYKAVDSELTFTEPEGQLHNIPDFRNTVYWNPAVKSNNGRYTVKFRAPDLKGDYIISVEGLTSEGKPVSLTKRIRVK
jgi:hypothetical protein